MANMITALTSATFNKLQLNAGVFLTNFDMSSYTTASALRTALSTAISAGTTVLGATRGGGTFRVEQETRDPDVDGKRYRFKGGTFVDSVDAYLTGTLVEIKKDMFAKILATGRVATSSAVHTVTMNTTIAPADYITTLTWVGDMSDGGVVVIELKNALNTNGLTLTFADKNEGTIPFEFHAHQDTVSDYDTAPFKVYFIDPAAST